MATTVTSSYPVTGMSCASCAMRVETTLKKTEGVKSAQVNFAASNVMLEYTPETASALELKQTLNEQGYDIIIEDDQEEAEALQEVEKATELKALKRHTIGAALLTIPIMIIGMAFPGIPYAEWLMGALAAPVVLYYGKRFFVSGFRQLRHGNSNMDTLVSVSTGIAFLFSLFNTFYPEYWTSRGMQAHVYYEAAAAIIAFILLGKYLEEKAKAGTSTAIKKLMGLRPKSVIRINRDGLEESVSLRDVIAGDILLVKPGESIPVDGVVREGASFVDESMMSGEPIPVAVTEGQKVYAGTINQKGSFKFLAEKVGEQTLLSQIIQMVREAQGSKAPVQKLVDKIAGIFVPTVLGISVLTFLIWMLIGGDGAFTHALLTSVTVLVIACPCALGLATPTAIMVGVGKGAQNNILIKDAESLELAHKLDVVLLDKTGTITEGAPRVMDIQWTSRTENIEELSGVLLGIEMQSEHPLAGAVVETLTEQKARPTALDEFESITGMGVRARLAGREYLVGNLRLMETRGIAVSPEQDALIRERQALAQTTVYFSAEGRLQALVFLADAVKTGSRAAVKALQKRGLRVIMLTGDNQETGAAVAAEVGVNDFQAQMLPGDKADFVKELQSQGELVAMVGDGINDSQALAQANVGIAMGKGSDIAMDTAKMTLITSDLKLLPKALELSGQTVRTIKQNLFWAFIYNLIGIPLAAGVLFAVHGFLLNPMIAAGAMAFSSVSVVLNSLRLKGGRL